jgi:adenylate cyclase
MQDQIVRSIAAQLFGRLRLANLEKASRKPPSSMAAYDYVLRGDALPIGVPEAEAEARNLFQKAIDLDPGYARAYAHLATCITFQWTRDYEGSARLLDQALELAMKAVALDDGEEFCHSVLGYVYLQRNAHELAEFHYLKALALNPNHPGLLASLGILYGFRGETARSLAYFREAITISPHFNPSWYWRNRAVVHFIAREYEEAISAFKRSPIMPEWVEAFLAAAHAQLGRMDEARQHVAAAHRLTPNLNIQAIMTKEPYLHREDAIHLADALRKAGFDD